VFAIQELDPGRRIKLKGGIVAEVKDNPRDGSWLVVRYITVPDDPSLVGQEELASADDVVEFL
jgi:hypothetical protein